MPSYRYYRTTVQGRIVNGDWVEADDLEDAERKVRELCAGEPCDCEIWQGAERLAAFGCGKPAGCGGGCEPA